MTTTKKQQNLWKSNEELWAKFNGNIEKIITKNFSASFMSNAKWRKVFSLLANSIYPISCYRWKFVDEEKLYGTQIIGINELEEKHLKDGNNQPFSYKEIEWLEVVTSQGEAISDELLKRGQFAIDKSESGFRIIGYARNKDSK